MSRSRDIVVTGQGAVTPVGLSVEAACAALRAGVSRMQEIETHHVDGEFFDKVPVVGGRVPTEWFDGEPVPEEWPGHERFEVPPPPSLDRLVAPGVERLVELAVPAAREAWAEADPDVRGADRIGLYLGLPEGEDPAPVADAVREAIGNALEPVTAFPEGRAAGLRALKAAVKDLAAGEVRGALVGGVDSLIRGPVLVRLEEAGILRSESVPQGVIPGEAAAFVYLEAAGTASGRHAPALARLLAAGSAEEPTAGTDEPNRAEGLTKALRQVHRNGGVSPVPPLVVCDLNGDRYRAMEWAMASIRTVGKLHGDMEIWHPADCIGDPGAASGLLNIVWAVVAFRKRYAPAERALVWGASDGRLRAAVMLAPA